GVDLYEAFTSIARDEEAFRTELEQYAGYDDEGAPRALPIDVPPLVTQRLPWLKPTSPTKMHNSDIISKGIGGRIQDSPLQAPRGDGAVMPEPSRMLSTSCARSSTRLLRMTLEPS